MSYPDAAWERAMTVQQVMLKALSGEIHWYRRRTSSGFRRGRYAGGANAMSSTGISAWSTNGHSPSVRRIAAPEVERLLRLYRERYCGFNVRHFHQVAQREHGVTVCTAF